MSNNSESKAVAIRKGNNPQPTEVEREHLGNWTRYVSSTPKSQLNPSGIIDLVSLVAQGVRAPSEAMRISQGQRWSKLLTMLTVSTDDTASKEVFESHDRLVQFLKKRYTTFDIDESGENELNERRLELYRKALTNEFLSLVRESVFEFGFQSIAEDYIRGKLSENALAVKEWLNELFIEHYRDEQVVSGVLRIVSHLDYEEIYPQGPTMAIAAISHKSVQVQELGIRAFENWGNEESLSALEGVAVTTAWLGEYLNGVVEDLRIGR